MLRYRRMASPSERELTVLAQLRLRSTMRTSRKTRVMKLLVIASSNFWLMGEIYDRLSWGVEISTSLSALDICKVEEPFAPPEWSQNILERWDDGIGPKI